MATGQWPVISQKTIRRFCGRSLELRAELFNVLKLECGGMTWSLYIFCLLFQVAVALQGVGGFEDPLMGFEARRADRQ